MWLLILGIGAGGGVGLLMAITWPRYYGRSHLGAISGLAMAIQVAGSAVGPYLFSLSLDLTGSYAGAAWACLCVAVSLLLLSFRANRPSGITTMNP